MNIMKPSAVTTTTVVVLLLASSQFTNATSSRDNPLLRPCLDMKVSSASSSSSPLCCQCNENPESYHCLHSCQPRMFTIVFSTHKTGSPDTRYFIRFLKELNDSLFSPSAEEVRVVRRTTTILPQHDNSATTTTTTGTPLQRRKDDHVGNDGGNDGDDDGDGDGDGDGRPQSTQFPLNQRSIDHGSDVTDIARGQVVVRRPQRAEDILVTCGSCHKACLTCWGPGPQRCLRCSEGYSKVCDGTASSCECVEMSAPRGRPTTGAAVAAAATATPTMPTTARLLLDTAVNLESNTYFMMTVASLLMSLVVMSLAVVVILCRLRKKMQRAQKKWMPKPAQTSLLEQSFSNDHHDLECANDNKPDTLHTVSTDLDHDNESEYAEIGGSRRGSLEVHMEKDSSFKDCGRGLFARPILPVMVKTRSLPASVKERVSLLGRGAWPAIPETFPAWVVSKPVSTRSHADRYPDYRSPLLKSSCKEEEEETRLKIPTTQRLWGSEAAEAGSLPPPLLLSVCAARVKPGRGGDCDASLAPPLPPRNNRVGEGEEPTTQQPSSYSSSSSSSSLLLSSSSSQQDTFPDDSGLDGGIVLPSSQAAFSAAEKGVGSLDNEDAVTTGSPTVTKRGGGGQESERVNRCRRHHRRRRRSCNRSRNSSKHLYLTCSKKNATTTDVDRGEATGLCHHNSPDSATCSLSLLDPHDYFLSDSFGTSLSMFDTDESYPTAYARSYQNALSGGTDGEALLYSCGSRMQTRVGFYDLETSFSDVYLPSFLSSDRSSLWNGSESQCSVSNPSSTSSSGYGTHSRPSIFTSERSRTIRMASDVSLTLEEVYPSSTVDDKKYTPDSVLWDGEMYASCSSFLRTPSPLVPDYGQKLLTDSWFMNTPGSFSDTREAKRNNVMNADLTTTGSAQTADPGSKENGGGGPAFSPGWQKEQTVSHHGGIVQTDGSAVLLEIPPAAVPVGETLTIRASVSTNLDQAYNKLDIPDTDHIASPIAEYFAGVNVKFLKPVRILLPHFLPRKHTKEQVSVYVFHRDLAGKLSLQKLKLWDRKRGEDAMGPQVSDVFAFGDDRHLEIFVDHFSGYLCTCQSTRLAQELNLVLFARNLQKQGTTGRGEGEGTTTTTTMSTTGSGCSEVLVRLEVWDNRLDVPDFQQACFQRTPTANEMHMRCIDRKSLPVPDDGGGDGGGGGEGAVMEMQMLTIGCELDHKTEEDSRLWPHSTRRNGQLMYPVRSTIPLKTMFSCDCYRPVIPKRVDWKLTRDAAAGVAIASPEVFECLVDVGYVRSDRVQLNQPFSFLQSPPPVTIDVSVLPTMEQEATTGDVFCGNMYRTMKQLATASTRAQATTTTTMRNDQRDRALTMEGGGDPFPAETVHHAREPSSLLQSYQNRYSGMQRESGQYGFSELSDVAGYVPVETLRQAGFMRVPREGAGPRSHNGAGMSPVNASSSSSSCSYPLLSPPQALSNSRPPLYPPAAAQSLDSGSGSSMWSREREPRVTNTTIIMKADQVNVAGSLEGSSSNCPGDSSSAPSSMHCASMASSASSENAAMGIAAANAARRSLLDRRTSPKLELSRSAAQLLDPNLSDLPDGPDGISEGLYGYPESDQSDLENGNGRQVGSERGREPPHQANGEGHHVVDLTGRDFNGP